MCGAATRFNNGLETTSHVTCDPIYGGNDICKWPIRVVTPVENPDIHKTWFVTPLLNPNVLFMYVILVFFSFWNYFIKDKAAGGYTHKPSVSVISKYSTTKLTQKDISLTFSVKELATKVNQVILIYTVQRKILLVSHKNKWTQFYPNI